MGFTCGIVGLPNVGKSTLFNAITSAGIAAENYPFCTIKPNTGVVLVPDPRLDELTKIIKPKQTVPTTIEFVDIAGLVRGASQGEGLGNQFLGHIRTVDAVAHVVRCFEDENVTHVDDSINPVRDIETIETELILKDLDTVEKRIEGASRRAKANEKEAKEAKEELAVAERLRAYLSDGNLAITFERENDREENILCEFHLLTDKPVMYIANTDEDGVQNGNQYIDAIKKIAQPRRFKVVPVCAKIEAELSELDADERAEFLESMGMSEPGLNTIIRQGYSLLGLITYFTAEEKECRAWTVHKGATAPEAAGVIHTDFQIGFIRAEVQKYDDLLRLRSEQKVKDAGLYRIEGKDYIVQDGDVIYFRFNV